MPSTASDDPIRTELVDRFMEMVRALEAKSVPNYNNPNYQTLLALAAKEKTPPEALSYFAAKKDYDRDSADRGDMIASAQFEDADNYAPGSLALAALRNRSTPEADLTDAAHSDSAKARLAVTQNTSTSFEVLRELTSDPDAEIRENASFQLQNVRRTAAQTFVAFPDPGKNFSRIDELNRARRNRDQWVSAYEIFGGAAAKDALLRSDRTEEDARRYAALSLVAGEARKFEGEFNELAQQALNTAQIATKDLIPLFDDREVWIVTTALAIAIGRRTAQIESGIEAESSEWDKILPAPEFA